MIDPENVPPVTDAELLARYVTTSRHFRYSDNTVKQDLFMPHPYVAVMIGGLFIAIVKWLFTRSMV